MTWNISISAVPKEQFADAVDAAEASGQPAELIEADVTEAKATLKQLGARLGNAKVGGTASGHVPEGVYQAHDLAVHVFSYTE